MVDRWDSWINCDACESEFKIVTSVAMGSLEFCPYCSSELNLVDEDEDFEEDE
jgi:hypothetical protein